MLSVVIPVWNNAEELGAQLEAVAAQRLTEDWEIVLADNGSTDGSVEIAQRWALKVDRLRVIDASDRRGPSVARNLGARAARGDRLVFCDADDVVAVGWLESLSKGLARAAVAVGALDVCSLNGRSPAPPLDPSPYQFGYLPAGLGANMAVTRAAFDAAHGFDEELLVGEDIDFCWRLQLMGFQLECVMSAVVAKRSRSTGSRTFRQALSYGRSDAVLFRRFRPDGMPRRLWLTVRSWGWLVLHLPSLLDPTSRRPWLRALFIRLGRLVGCFEQRVFYP